MKIISNDALWDAFSNYLTSQGVLCEYHDNLESGDYIIRSSDPYVWISGAFVWGTRRDMWRTLSDQWNCLLVEAGVPL